MTEFRGMVELVGTYENTMFGLHFTRVRFRFTTTTTHDQRDFFIFTKHKSHKLFYTFKLWFALWYKIAYVSLSRNDETLIYSGDCVHRRSARVT